MARRDKGGLDVWGGLCWWRSLSQGRSSALISYVAVCWRSVGGQPIVGNGGNTATTSHVYG